MMDRTYSPTSVDERESEAAAALASGDTDTAVALYREMLTTGSASKPRVRFGLAVCYARRKAWEDAERELTRVIEAAPASAIAFAYRGTVRVELAQVDAGRADLDEALRLEPGNGVVRLKRGESLLRLGMLRDAYAEFQAAARLPAPDDATREYSRALLLATRKALGGVTDGVSLSPLLLWERIRTWLGRPRSAAHVGLVD